MSLTFGDEFHFSRIADLMLFFSIMTRVTFSIIIVKIIFIRRRKMKNHFYIPSSQSQRDDLPLWDLESLDNESGKTPIPANIFPQVCFCYCYCVTVVLSPVT